MKNTVNQYPPSITVPRKKDYSTIILEKHSINLETQFRSSIQHQSSRTQDLSCEILSPKTKNSNPNLNCKIRKLKHRPYNQHSAFLTNLSRSPRWRIRLSASLVCQFREFEPHRVYTRMILWGLLLVHKLTCGKRESVI